jgi:hypothetical protein
MTTTPNFIVDPDSYDQLTFATNKEMIPLPLQVHHWTNQLNVPMQ